MIIIGTALLSAMVALGLTRWMRGVAKVESVWLRWYLHVALAGVLGTGAALLADNWAELVGYALLGIGCALLTVVDLAAMRLPNVMVGPLYLILLAALAVSAVVTGDGLRLLAAVGCSMAMLALYLGLVVIRPGQLGMGDVKFGAVIGLFLGWLGWGEAMLGVLAAFMLCGAGSVFLMWFFKMRREHMLPFGPFMVAGAAVGAAMGPGFLVIV